MTINFGQGQAQVLARVVGYLETGDLVVEFRDEIVIHVTRLSLTEHTVTRTGSSGCFVGSLLSKESSLGVDGEDAHEIGAEIGNHDELLAWVEDGLVGVGLVLSVGNRARARHVEG